MVDGLRIKFFTRSCSLELYRLSSGLYRDLGYPCVRLTDQTADGYFYAMLKDTECDVAVNVDEDAFLVNPDALLELIGYVVENGYANAGCPDGGMDLRICNPIVTNPYFNILNLKLLKTVTLPLKRTEFDYAAVRGEMEAAFPTEMLYGRYDFDRTDQEPYYPFFLWMARHFKTLYLRAEKHADGISSVLYMPDNRRVLCLHSWFSRFYKSSVLAKIMVRHRGGVQTQRIDRLIDEAYRIRRMERPHFSAGDRLAFFVDRVARLVVKIPQRMGRWPQKIARKIRRNAKNGSKP